jgi:hypothetical protein
MSRSVAQYTMRLVVCGHGNASVKDNARDATPDERVFAS